MAQAIVTARRTVLSNTPRGAFERLGLRAFIAFLHVLQPLARLSGRLRHGLTIWRKRGPDAMSFPRPRTLPIWIGKWQAPDQRLYGLKTAMKSSGAIVVHGGDYDSWDLEARGGMFGSTRLLMAVEDSGSGTQLVRLRCWPHCDRLVWVTLFALASLSIAAVVTESPGPAIAFGSAAALLLWRAMRECAATTRTILTGLASRRLLQHESAAGVLEPSQKEA